MQAAHKTEMNLTPLLCWVKSSLCVVVYTNSITKTNLINDWIADTSTDSHRHAMLLFHYGNARSPFRLTSDSHTVAHWAQHKHRGLLCVWKQHTVKACHGQTSGKAWKQESVLVPVARNCTPTIPCHCKVGGLMSTLGCHRNKFITSQSEGLEEVEHA